MSSDPKTLKFLELYKKHGGQLLAYARHLCQGQEANAKDVLQDGLKKLWASFSRGAECIDVDDLLPRAYRNIRDEFLDWCRRENRRPFSNVVHEKANQDALDELCSQEPLPSEMLDRSDFSELLALAMEKLKPSVRQAITLFYLTEPIPTSKEIALKLGVAVSGLRKYKQRALKALKDALRHQFAATNIDPNSL